MAFTSSGMSIDSQKFIGGSVPEAVHQPPRALEPVTHVTMNGYLGRKPIVILCEDTTNRAKHEVIICYTHVHMPPVYPS